MRTLLKPKYLKSNTDFFETKHSQFTINQDAGRNCTLDGAKPPQKVPPKPPPKAEPATEPASDDIDPDDELAMWDGTAVCLFSEILLFSFILVFPANSHHDCH